MGLLDDAIREHLELKRRRGADATEVSRQEKEALGPARRPAGTASAEPDPEDRDEFFDGEEDFAAGAPAATDEPLVGGADPFDEPFSDGPPMPPPRGFRDEHGVEDEPLPPAPPPAAPEPYTPEPARRAPLPEEDAWDDDTAAIVEDAAPPPEPRRTAAERLADLDAMEARGVPPQSPPPAAAQPTTEFSARDHEAAVTPPPPPARPPAAPSSHDDEPDIVPADDEPGGEDLLEETPEFLEETPEHDRLWFEQRPPRDFDFDG
jgi:hypothetical protein